MSYIVMHNVIEDFSISLNFSVNYSIYGESVIVLLSSRGLKPLAKYFRSFLIVLLLSLLAINCFDVFVYCDVGGTCLFMTPSVYVAEEIGEIFDVAINVSGVINLHSLEFTLAYNTSLLDVKQVFQGSFFSVPPSSNFEFENNELLGLIEVNMSLVGLGSSKSGDGDLVRISFEAVTGSESCASSPFGLRQTLLLDTTLKPIPHESVGGVYFGNQCNLILLQPVDCWTSTLKRVEKAQTNQMVTL